MGKGRPGVPKSTEERYYVEWRKNLNLETARQTIQQTCNCSLRTGPHGECTCGKFTVPCAGCQRKVAHVPGESICGACYNERETGVRQGHGKDK